MSQYYDIYGLSNERNKKTIEAFLDHFCFRLKIEDRTGQDFGFYNGSDSGIVEVETLSEVIDYGVKNSRHCFAFYIGDFLKDGVDHVILKFTNDGKMIFGISLHHRKYTDDVVSDNYEGAVEIAHQIQAITNAIATSIQFEESPADDQQEFLNSVELWKGFNEEKKSEDDTQKGILHFIRSLFRKFE